MSARGRVKFVVLETLEAQSACDLADPRAETPHTFTSYFVIVVVLMFAACGKVNVDITTVECLLQKISQRQFIVMRWPVPTVVAELERQSVCEFEFDAGNAAPVPITTLDRKFRYLEAK